MPEPRNDQDWVQRYISDQLSQEAIDAFEERLMDDPGLQEELEVALAISQTLRLDEQSSDPVPFESEPVQQRGAYPWMQYATAASVVLAVVCAGLLWNARLDQGALREQLQALSVPTSQVMNVRMDIMRSGQPDSPGIIIQRPSGNVLILVDVELPASLRNAKQLDLALEMPDGQTTHWQVQLNNRDRIDIAIKAQQLPLGVSSLVMSESGTNKLVTRLIEVR